MNAVPSKDSFSSSMYSNIKSYFLPVVKFKIVGCKLKEAIPGISPGSIISPPPPEPPPEDSGGSLYIQIPSHEQPLLVQIDSLLIAEQNGPILSHVYSPDCPINGSKYQTQESSCEQVALST